MLGPAVEAALPAGIAVESELRRDHDFIAERGEGFAKELLVGEGAIDFGRIEEGNSLFNGRTDDGDHLLLFPGRAIHTKAHAHTAQAEGRDFQITFSKFALL